MGLVKRLVVKTVAGVEQVFAPLLVLQQITGVGVEVAVVTAEVQPAPVAMPTPALLAPAVVWFNHHSAYPKAD